MSIDFATTTPAQLAAALLATKNLDELRALLVALDEHDDVLIDQASSEEKLRATQLLAEQLPDGVMERLPRWGPVLAAPAADVLSWDETRVLRFDDDPLFGFYFEARDMVVEVEEEVERICPHAMEQPLEVLGPTPAEEESSEVPAHFIQVRGIQYPSRPHAVDSSYSLAHGWLHGAEVLTALREVPSLAGEAALHAALADVRLWCRCPTCRAFRAGEWKVYDGQWMRMYACEQCRSVNAPDWDD